MDIFEEFFYGKISPFEIEFRRKKEYQENLSKLVEVQDKLTETLNDEQRVMFENFDEKVYKSNELANLEFFEYGFCLGVNLLLDTLK